MPDAITILTQDHRKVDGLFDQYRSGQDPEVVRQICNELTVHTAIEEAVLYPVLPDVAQGERLREEAEREHREVKDAIAQIEGTTDTGTIDELMQTVMDGVTHHVEEEESEIFPRLQSDLGPDRLSALGDQLLAAKREHLVASGHLIDLTREELAAIADASGVSTGAEMSKEELVQALEQRP